MGPYLNMKDIFFFNVLPILEWGRAITLHEASPYKYLY